MKKIIRPDSTTYVFEESFHLIKNRTELKNVLSDVKMENVLVWARLVDTESFQPRVAFAIKRDGHNIATWLKYITSFETVIDAGIANFPTGSL